MVEMENDVNEFITRVIGSIIVLAMTGLIIYDAIVSKLENFTSDYYSILFIAAIFLTLVSFVIYELFPELKNKRKKSLPACLVQLHLPRKIIQENQSPISKRYNISANNLGKYQIYME